MSNDNRTLIRENSPATGQIADVLRTVNQKAVLITDPDDKKTTFDLASNGIKRVLKYAKCWLEDKGFTYRHF